MIQMGCDLHQFFGLNNLFQTDVENIDANKFLKISTGTRSRGKQWTYGALSIFELSLCKYDHLNNTRHSILKASLIFTHVRHLIYLYIYKIYNYIHGKYIWNRSVMLKNNACFMKRNIGVKHMTRKESLRNNEKQCGFDTLRLRRKEYV